MGLDTTHDCWHGPYRRFHDFRVALAATIGLDLDSMERYGGVVPWETLEGEPLTVLLDHSDCDGYIASEQCGPLADRMESLLPGIMSSFPDYTIEEIVADARRFIAGLRAASAAREPVLFA